MSTCPTCGQRVMTAEQLTARGKAGAKARWGAPAIKTGESCAACGLEVYTDVTAWRDDKPYHVYCVAPVDHEKKPVPIVPRRLDVDAQVVRMTGHEVGCTCLRCGFARTDLGG